MAVNGTTQTKTSAYDGFKSCAKKVAKNLFNLTPNGFICNIVTNTYNGNTQPIKKAAQQTYSSSKKIVNCVFNNPCPGLKEVGKQQRQQRISDGQGNWFDKLTQ